VESADVGDNVIAILARLRDHKEAVRKIVERIAGLAAAERETALAQLMILAGLRHLSRTVEQERRKMPIDVWAGEKLAASSASELEDLAERVLDAKSVAELLR
jgi:hypothetical protein